MIAKAEAKYMRLSVRKTRLVIDLIKGKTVEQAEFILNNTNKGACPTIKKVLDSVFANANNERQEKFLTKDLFISAISADGGPMLKRFRAATMGRATPIRHRTAHIHIELDKVKETK
ncbi:MAG: 50S ribosomal protein L22 [Candidatus Omnitrophica bacterium]|nr:50S ribosomal protein L22 [Candidatus Omnitrophota bacterium]